MKINEFNTVQLCEQGAWLTIKDFDECDTDMEIKVVGVDSKKFKSQVNRISKMSSGSKTPDMERLEESSIRTLVAITIDWKNVEDEEGNEIPHSDEKALEVYTASPYISAQIIEFAKDRKNFLEKK